MDFNKYFLGLSYLTLDADVKEKLCEDEAAIKALVELAKQVSQPDMKFKKSSYSDYWVY